MRILSSLLLFIMISNLCAESFFESASNRYDEITSSSEFQTLQRAYNTYRSSRNQERPQGNIQWIARDEQGVEHAYLVEDDQSNRDAQIMCQGWQANVLLQIGTSSCSKNHSSASHGNRQGQDQLLSYARTWSASPCSSIP